MSDQKSKRKDPMAVLWAASNRNVLTEVARKFGVSPQFCHYVLYGKRRSEGLRIERALRELGAPIQVKSA